MSVMMNLNRQNKNQFKNFSAKLQSGFVLFVALIALVAMSLAAAALIRSVDSSVLVAGNLASKQSATLAADTSISIAQGRIQAGTINTAADDLPKGYYASVANDSDALNYLDLKDDATWTDAHSQLITSGLSPDIDANNKDVGGNTIRYVVQRMCRSSGAPLTDCIFGQAVRGGSSNSNICDQNGDCFNSQQGSSPLYRITSRVVGPKNTVSLIQAYVY
jgi:type IV pilus assembly protein PilX